MSKILSNWTLDDENVKSIEEQQKTINPIVRNTVIESGERLIQKHTPPKPIVETQITETTEVVPEKKNEPTEPLLQLIRNNEGIVIGIEVQCGCGEKIMIKMEY
jgi:hypothetical protein